MKPFSQTSYFKFSKSQRLGIFILLLFIALFQVIYFCFDFNIEKKGSNKQEEWMSLQSQIDSLHHNKKPTPKRYPFNPNFITDFKGYQLGMSIQEIDRLLEYRKTNQYVNSAKEFQKVTQISDSLLNIIAPYFKFPDWVSQKKNVKPFKSFNSKKKESLILIDINTANQEDLKKVYGIGDGLSLRILKEKEKFGGFVSMEQMNDIWGLSSEVIKKLNENFTVATIPELKKIKINSASVKELSQFPYFKYALAKAIVTHRSMNGVILNPEELTKISGFPVDKVNIIALYLEF